MAHKTLYVFCDGTGMDGSRGRPTKLDSLISSVLDLIRGNRKKLAQPHGGGSSGRSQALTNVLRLARSIKSHDEDGNEQIVFYQSGVGSETDFAGDPLRWETPLMRMWLRCTESSWGSLTLRKLDRSQRVLGLPLVRPLAGLVDLEAFANPLSAYFTASKIRDAYVFIAQNFEAGDQICLFGCVGVWNIVGFIFNTNNALNIADTSLPATVEVALHALSVQENREKFLPTLWTLPSGGLKPGQVQKQICMASTIYGNTSAEFN
ncbi:hypothetical protein V5O48_009439 [Marasmius crinis-equi]|uniref:T6SS Phospholipase effector Tle1-like catalytic domain-containing protein n=1 Tax=Marasmius crinis-equi TaxID=585013 RepID=A0ABR3FBN1_9AGAR